jgi:hypothetical protein
MIRILFVVSLIFIPFSTTASSEKQRLAKEYASLTASVASDASQSIADAMAPQLSAILLEKNPNADKSDIYIVLDELSAVLKKQLYEMGFYEDVFWPVYNDMFSLEELRAIVSFYKTPAGQKLLKNTIPLLKESEKRTGMLIQNRMPSVIESLKERILKKGLDIEI